MFIAITVVRLTTVSVNRSTIHKARAKIILVNGGTTIISLP